MKFKAVVFLLITVLVSFSHSKSIFRSEPLLKRNILNGISKDLLNTPQPAANSIVSSIATRITNQWNSARILISKWNIQLRGIPQLLKLFGVVTVAIGVASVWLNNVLWTPSRKYDQASNSVGKEYDAWEREGILEHYWGEHIHLGYYEESVRRGDNLSLLPPRKNFIQAKLDFIEEMLRFGHALPSQLGLGRNSTDASSLKILDVGCGIGGTSRFLAKKFGNSTSVVGITLSGNQVKRAAQLAKEQGIGNVDFRVMDALSMDFPDNSFDLVWACESGEHMPDKRRYIEEMTRVLKPGGRIVVATWCQRDENGRPFNAQERRMLDFLYAEWTHPHFISISDYAKLMEETGRLRDVETADWTPQTIASWLHSIWVGVYDPWPVFSQPRLYWKCFRDGLTLVHMHKSFKSKLMQYGMMTATKCEKLCD